MFGKFRLVKCQWKIFLLFFCFSQFVCNCELHLFFTLNCKIYFFSCSGQYSLYFFSIWNLLRKKTNSSWRGPYQDSIVIRRLWGTPKLYWNNSLWSIMIRTSDSETNCGVERKVDDDDDSLSSDSWLNTRYSKSGQVLIISKTKLGHFSSRSHSWFTTFLKIVTGT